jgi:hypothetical protein
MPFQVIPVDNSPNQHFDVTLQINDVNRVFTFDVRWNTIAGYWVMTLTDPATGLLVLDSIPLITGEGISSNLLESYDALKIGAAFLLNYSNVALNYPNQNTLGNAFELVWTDNI